MFNKENINLIYRVICLFIYSFVVIFSNSNITLITLAILFFIFTRNVNNFFYVFLYLLSFVFFLVGYASNSYGLFKFFLIIEYMYYFLDIPGMQIFVNKAVDKIIVEKKENIEKGEVDKEQDIDEYNYLRFESFRKKSTKKYKADMKTTLYITVHFVILFLSIIVG